MISFDMSDHLERVEPIGLDGLISYPTPYSRKSHFLFGITANNGWMDIVFAIGIRLCPTVKYYFHDFILSVNRRNSDLQKNCLTEIAI